MKILLAGATGTLGGPLIRQFNAAGHEVVGIARTPQGVERLRTRGAGAVLADVLDRDAFLRAVENMSADAVVHELTDLKKAPATFGAMKQTNRLRIEGTANLVEAAQLIGAKRMITQSIVFGYGYTDHGHQPVTEETPFGEPRGDATDVPVQALLSTETQVRQAEGIAGIALRYGLFYGDDILGMKRSLNRFALPVPSYWRGKIPLIHHWDAASATVAALERGVPGRAYNIVDDLPVSWHEFITTVARETGARKPVVLPDAVLRAVAPYAGALITRLSMRVSNDLAKKELRWEPRYPTVADGVKASS